MRILWLLALITLLGACGGGPEDRAVAACEKEIGAKFSDKTFAVDQADMRAKATPDGEGVYRIQSAITFDPGLPREVKQTFDCRVRISGDNADVITLTFIW